MLFTTSVRRTYPAILCLSPGISLLLSHNMREPSFFFYGQSDCPTCMFFSAEFYSAFSPSISAGFDPARRTLHLRKQQRRRYDHSAILADYRIMPDEKGGRHRIAQPVHLHGGNLTYLKICLEETFKTLPRHAVFRWSFGNKGNYKKKQIPNRWNPDEQLHILPKGFLLMP